MVLRLDHHSYDKEAHGGFKTEIPASLNVPLNERSLFMADKARCVGFGIDGTLCMRIKKVE